MALSSNYNGTLTEYFKNNHRRCSIKKYVLKIFEKFTGKHLCQSLFFNKVAGEIFQNTFFTEYLQVTASDIWQCP